MKQQISITMLLATIILFNGCLSTSYMQKAPDKKLWDKSKEFKTCDDTTAHVPIYRIMSYVNVIAGGIPMLGNLIRFNDTPLILSIPVFAYGIFQYSDSTKAIKEAQKCSEYKKFMLSQ